MAQIKSEFDQLADPAILDETEKLAEAVRYGLKHWERLTQFLSEPGIPLSNMEAEQAVRMPHARHRKASSHYKAEHGAHVGDVMMSMIASCEEAEEEPSDYFEAIQQYPSEVYKDPEGWMPWCYRDRIAALGKVPAGPPQDLEPTDRSSQPA